MDKPSAKPTKNSFNPVKPDVQIAKQEESILDLWDQEQIFKKSIDPKKKT
jgi:isoleucyl-tRNA synthetase